MQLPSDWRDGLTDEEAEILCKQYGMRTAEDDIIRELGLYSFGELTDADKQPPTFIVSDMIPVGLSFISGAPKTRKSFLALQLAIAVARGSPFLGHQTKQCGVCYFDLEGSKWRIADRARQMQAELPENILFTQRTEHKLADGLIDDLKRLHDIRKDIGLIIVDTYSRARGNFRSGGANAYDLDVSILEPIQRFAIDEQVAVVCVHHFKKNSDIAADSFERLSGTMGISGSCDSVLTLTSNGKRLLIEWMHISQQSQQHKQLFPAFPNL